MSLTGLRLMVCLVSLEWEQVVVAAQEPAALGRWWADALGWVVVNDSAEGAGVAWPRCLHRLRVPVTSSATLTGTTCRPSIPSKSSALHV